LWSYRVVFGAFLTWNNLSPTQQSERRNLMPTPEEQIAQLAPNWVWKVHHCIATDPAVQYAIEQGDPALRNQLIALTLETTAAAYRTLADGASRASQIVSGKSNG
jgi:hypothetical protein